jgi:hypothetical protein
MKRFFVGTGLLVLGLACTSGTPSEKPEVDLTEPGKVCEVHNIPLQTGRVPFAYGKPAYPSPEEIERKRKQFPNANSYISGGGCVVDENKLWGKASFCPECRKEEAAWTKEKYNDLFRNQDGR